MIAAAEAVPRLSWSQIDRYTRCPAQWWFSRHCKPEHTPSALKFGGAIHRSVETFYACRAEGYNPALDELMATYTTAWEAPSEAAVSFGKNETDTTLREMAGRMLGAFIEAVRPGEVLGIEESFAVEIVDGIIVSGVIDLVEVKDGRFWVVDNKTSRSDPSSAFDAEQLLLYRLGLAEVGLVPDGADVGMRFDCLRKLKTKSEFTSVEVTACEHDFLAVRQKIAAVARAIKAGVLYRNKSWACAGCPWTKACAETDLEEAQRRVAA